MGNRVCLTCALLLALTECPSPRGPAYFVVSEPYPAHGDSYLLVLNEPDDIRHARRLTRDPFNTASPIVVAKIAPASGNPVNEDFTGGGGPWSWHVTEFVEFADFTIEILDGWPGLVEQDVDSWIANTNGYIGFWSYTVTDELAEDEVTFVP